MRSAEGMELRKLKLGKFHGRAFRLARKMGVELNRVYVVPAGKGHLSSAYGLGKSIAITDNYGEWLDGDQLDFVICHELTHVKQQHGRKKLLLMLVLFSVLVLVVFWLPIPSRFLFAANIFVILGPTLAFYFVSRRFEYAADRGAVECTAAAETAILALRNI
ncbi:MAG TPA: M48 family metalloprotease, partial [Terriglobales bacterium]